MRVLISVSDKTGVVEFAKGLRTLGWEVIATGGTMKLLADSGVEVINISDAPPRPGAPPASPRAPPYAGPPRRSGAPESPEG